jgi:hypothetical protein
MKLKPNHDNNIGTDRQIKIIISNVIFSLEKLNYILIQKDNSDREMANIRKDEMKCYK